MNQALSRLTTCRIRDLWPVEERFSDWLAEDENLALLCDTLGIEPILEPRREANVGRYRADICGRLSDDSTVIIENQFGTTDHRHLGEIITYASGMDASMVIWIVEDVNEEHSQAVLWLNSNSERSFFLVKVSVLRIDDSNPAPLFTVIEAPNNYARAHRSRTSDTDSVRYGFWERFLRGACDDGTLKKVLPGIENRKPTDRSYINFTRGCEGYELVVRAYMSGQSIGKIRVEVWTLDPDLYHMFLRHREEIEDAVGRTLQWYSKESNKSSSVYHEITIDDSDDGSALSAAYDTMVSMVGVFNGFKEEMET